MARAIVSSLASMIHRLGNPIHTFLSSQNSFPLCRSMLEDLNKLDELLVSGTLQGVLDQAEERQWLEEGVWNRLTEFMDAAYDAEDALDEMHYEILRSSKTDDKAQPTDTSSMRMKEEVCDLFTSLACKIGNVKETLNQVLGQIDSIQLKASQSNNSLVDTTWSDRGYHERVVARETEIYGRKDDVDNVIDLVLSEIKGEPRIVAIVGEAGVGKTALLRLLCNDSRIRLNFPSRGWVRMAKDFDVVALKSEMTQAISFRHWRDGISGMGHWSCEDDEQSQCELEKLSCLVVLDDFCDDNRFHWETLHHLLQQDQARIKIIVVTRSLPHAIFVGTMPIIYHLSRLSEDSSWKLFQHHAFSSHENIQPDLAVIGKKIVQKCSGLPLSLELLGALLRDETREERWTAILNHNLWNVDANKHKAFTAPIILSYHFLPPHLQSCVLYCSVFPKPFLFKKDQLIRLWMAQSLIAHRQGKRVEEIGSDIFNELIRRSFFDYSGVSKETYVMHHALHDLAKCRSRRRCYNKYIKKKIVQSVYGNIEHISLIAKDTRRDVNSEFEVEGRSLRTVLLQVKALTRIPEHSWWVTGRHLDVSPLNLSFLSYLRTLILSYTDMNELPDSIGNLKHLRYLGLNTSRIRCLPQQISSLYHLQTLELRGCRSLESLPIGIENLTNLRHVDLVDAYERILLHQGVGKLTDLQTLSLFYVGNKKEHYVIRELGNLVNLRGDLHILGLHHVKDSGDAKSANLINKEFLEKLTLQWCHSNSCSCQQGLLSKYKDPECIEYRHHEAKSSIQIELVGDDEGTGKVAKEEDNSSIDSSVQEQSHAEAASDDMTALFDEVYKMVEAEEINWESPITKSYSSDDFLSCLANFDFGLDPCEEMRAMEERIRRMTEARVRQECVLQALRPHANLKELLIENYLGSKLSYWLGDPSFSTMASVSLFSCVNCKALPPLGQLPSLRYLSIKYFRKVKYVGREFCGNGFDVTFKAFPSLETLEFEGMYEWEEWVGVADGEFPHLSNLRLCACNKLKVAPKFPLISVPDTDYSYNFRRP